MGENAIVIGMQWKVRPLEPAQLVQPTGHAGCSVFRIH